MVCSGYTKVWDLATGELVKLDGARGTTLRVTRGTLWLTLEHDTRDVVLSAGDVFTIDRGGLTLIEAQSNTTVCVLAHTISAVRVRDRQPTFVERVRDGLRSVGAADSNRRFIPYF